MIPSGADLPKSVPDTFLWVGKVSPGGGFSVDTDTELPNNKPLNPALLTKPLPALKRAELSLTYTMNKVTKVAARISVSCLVCTYMC